MWFDSEKAMKRHKEQSDEHDYCKKCDQDFDDWDEWAQHKAFRPDTHDKACRICGQEFKTTSGLKRHIDLASSLFPTAPLESRLMSVYCLVSSSGPKATLLGLWRGVPKCLALH